MNKIAIVKPEKALVNLTEKETESLIRLLSKIAESNNSVTFQFSQLNPGTTEHLKLS
jgi:hypothetical protein